MSNGSWSPAHIQAFAIACSTDGCDARFTFRGGLSAEVLAQLVDAHDQGWQCLVSNVLEVTCPPCAARKRRRLQVHQVFRRKVAAQPDWKRDVILSGWAAIAETNREHLQEPEMAIAFQSLLGDTGRNAADVEASLYRFTRAFQGGTSENSAEALRMAEQALRL